MGSRSSQSTDDSFRVGNDSIVVGMMLSGGRWG